MNSCANNKPNGIEKVRKMKQIRWIDCSFVETASSKPTEQQPSQVKYTQTFRPHNTEKSKMNIQNKYSNEVILSSNTTASSLFKKNFTSTKKREEISQPPIIVKDKTIAKQQQNQHSKTICTDKRMSLQYILN